MAEPEALAVDTAADEGLCGEAGLPANFPNPAGNRPVREELEACWGDGRYGRRGPGPE